MQEACRTLSHSGEVEVWWQRCCQLNSPGGQCDGDAMHEFETGEVACSPESSSSLAMFFIRRRFPIQIVWEVVSPRKYAL